jgi:hypothetical protein
LFFACFLLSHHRFPSSCFFLFALVTMFYFRCFCLMWGDACLSAHFESWVASRVHMQVQLVDWGLH